MKSKHRLYKPTPSASKIATLSKSINVNPYLSHLLVQRGIDDFEKAKKFFRPSLKDLHDPFLMRDMDRAVARLKQALDSNEKILIYGDYDVDGTTAVALAYRFFKNLHPHCEYYIPDRTKEGYGISEAGIAWAVQHGCSLMLTLDLGTKSLDMIALGRKKGIDFIVCDHHMPGDQLPEAVAVLNPKVKGCTYPFKELSGCGIGFKLVQAFIQKYGMASNAANYLDLVAVSIASDIVPIVGENRILAFHGLKKLNQNPVLGLLALKETATLNNPIEVSDIVFKLAPRINAAGRVDHAGIAVNLLVAEEREEANRWAQQLENNNVLRKEWDMQATTEALSMLASEPAHRHARSAILYNENWNKGIVGIVAARCIETYYRPTIILTKSNGKIVGSGRSVKGFNLYQAIERCADLLENFGGHKYAIGVTLEEANLSAFRHRFKTIVSDMLGDTILIPTIGIDMELPLDAITDKFASILTQMAPFGPENPRPVFEAKNVFLVGSVLCFKDKHIRFSVAQKQGKTKKTAVGFNMSDYRRQLFPEKSFDIAFSIHKNEFQGQIAVELRIKEIKFAS